MLKFEFGTFLLLLSVLAWLLVHQVYHFNFRLSKILSSKRVVCSWNYNWRRLWEINWEISPIMRKFFFSWIVLLVNYINYARFAFLGACEMLAGQTRISISLTVIFVETTGNILYIIPIIFVITCAKLVGDCFNNGLFDIHIVKNKYL